MLVSCFPSRVHCRADSLNSRQQLESDGSGGRLSTDMSFRLANANYVTFSWNLIATMLGKPDAPAALLHARNQENPKCDPIFFARGRLERGYNPRSIDISLASGRIRRWESPMAKNTFECLSRIPREHYCRLDFVGEAGS